MAFTYTPNMPVASNFPSDDEPLMNQNSQYLNAFALRDHEFTKDTTNANDGTHKQLTLNDVMVLTPGFTGASSVLFSKQAQSVSCLFFDNNGTPVQLSSVPPILTNNGGTWLPGGLLMIWGTASGAGGSTINFHTNMKNPAFSGKAIFVSVVALSAPPGGGSAYVAGIASLTATSFGLANTSGAPGAFNIGYLAIGPA